MAVGFELRELWPGNTDFGVSNIYVTLKDIIVLYSTQESMQNKKSYITKL